MEYHLLEAYFLDFSYYNTLNLESRVFLSLPHKDIYTNELKIFNIGFEMNSSYKVDKGKVKSFLSFLKIDDNNLYNDSCTLYIESEFLDKENIFKDINDNLTGYLNTFKTIYLEKAEAIINKYNNTEEERKIAKNEISIRINRFLCEVEKKIDKFVNNDCDIYTILDPFNITCDINDFKNFISYNEDKNNYIKVKNNKSYLENLLNNKTQKINKNKI